MVIISQHRFKCIGCNHCVEMAPDRWQMSQKDGKSVLLDAKEKKGVFTIRVADHELEANKKAAMGCPVNIIKVKKG